MQAKQRQKAVKTLLHPQFALYTAQKADACAESLTQVFTRFKRTNSGENTLFFHASVLSSLTIMSAV
jgi:hypothetical protein